MRITLVNPPLGRAALYEEWDLSLVDSVSPPLGLLLLAAVAREAGHEAAVIDAFANRLTEDQTVRDILATRPDIVGFTATTPAIHAAATVARKLRQQAPGLPIVIGGAHITAVPEVTFNLFREFDLGVIGEGEETLKDLLGELSKAQPDLSAVAGLIFSQEGQIVRTSTRPFIKDLDRLPLPAWDLLPSLTDPYRLSIVGTKSDRATAIVTSRGCPGRCTFCDRSVFGTRYRGYSARYVLRMIDVLINHYGIEDLLIYDDNFVANGKRLQEICECLIQGNYNISWSCCARVDMVNPGKLALMKKAGCWQIEFGIESGSPKILECMNKRITLEKVEQAVRWAKEAGIMTRGNFIFGYLGETKATLNETLEFLLRLDLDYFQQTFLTPYPGSEVYETALQYGQADLDWTNLNNLAINFVPHELTSEDLSNFSRKAFRRFYLRPRVIWTHLQQLRSLYAVKRLSLAFLAFLKTILGPRRREARMP